MADPAEDRGDNLDELMPDAALATDIPDEKARAEEQLAYYGGEKDEVDDEDFSSVDRGDSLEPPELEDEEEEEEQTAEAEGDEPADEDALDDGEPDADTDPEEAVDDDEESDASEGDDGDVAEPDAEDDDDEDPRGRNQRVPLSRFNEVNERMKAAERRLAELENQSKAVEEVAEGKYDFDAAEEEYTELLLNGDTKGAATKRAEIRSAEREAFLQEAQQTTHETITQDTMLNELNLLTAQASDMYPVFNDKSDDYNPAATQKVLTFMKGYLAEGSMSPADAFVAALADGIELYGLDAPVDQPANEEVDPQPKKKAAKKQVEEKTKLAEKTPKSPAGLGKGSVDAGAVVPDIEKMSDAELEALPAETIARLRGDFVD